MSCDCECGCTDECENCGTVCTSLIVQNSWNIPACGASAILSVPGLESVLIGSYLYNPSYGYFRISAFDSVNGQITIVNDCTTGNEDPGVVVPALTEFILSSPPALSNLLFNTLNSWVVPACGSNVTVTAPTLVAVTAGMNVWNPTYGYFEVVSFNDTTKALVLKNNCVNGNIAVGSTVVADSSFILTTPPPAGEAITWTPGVTGSGGLTIAALVIEQATYWEVGNINHFILGIACTLGGVTSTDVIITLDTDAIGFSNSVIYMSCDVFENGTFSTQGRWRVTTGSPGTIHVQKGSAANWTLGAFTVYIQGFYQRV